MPEIARNQNVSWIARDMHEKSYIKVQDIIINRGTVVDNFYMDEITVSPLEVKIVRKGPALPNDNVIVNKVEVQQVLNETAYDVQIVPWTCNPTEDDLELLGIDEADIVGLDTSGMTPLEAWNARSTYLKSSENVTYSSSQWMGGTVTIERTKEGTKAVTGNFSLSWGDKTIVLPPYPTPESIKSVLEGFGITGINTWISGRRARCYETVIDIDFATSIGGDVPQIGFNGTNLNIENNGLWTQMMTTTSINGGIKVPGPGGDFFRQIVSQPTISVTVDGFLASCGAPDCTFTHDSSLTPSLSSVASAVVGGSVELSIAGSDFTSNITDFIITVGSLNCEVSDATSSEITCILDPGAAGTYDVDVVVKSRGIAEQPESGQLTHTVMLEIFSNTPTVGSLGGGTSITVYGSGFPATLDAWGDGSVTIEGCSCKITKTTFSEFECLTSAKPSGGRYKRSTADISITIGSSSISGGSCTYDASLTPTLSSVSPSSSSPLGGEVLHINGSALGAAWGKVLLGDNECTIIAWYPTYITCILPPNTHGVYPVHVEVTGNGFGDVSSVSGVSYDFVVTDVTPRKGSTLGGTMVKISGSGFGNCSNIDVKFGDLMTCEVSECSNTELICNTERISKVHQLNNGGRHPDYGPGYVWSDIELEILPGDTVEWVCKWRLRRQEYPFSK